MQALNISEKNKVFVWTPAHTASRLAWKIFDNFEFSSYDVMNGGVLLKNSFEHNHYIGLPKNHLDYKLILTCRNPYTQSTSCYDGMFPKKVQEGFEIGLESRFQEKYHFNFISLLKYRKPDYFIRVENLLEDYLKIPFIRESEFYKSGELEKLMNKNPFKEKVYYHRPVLDKRLADLIYYNFSYYFDLVDYDRNSWKK
jgi:hypothetical protein